MVDQGLEDNEELTIPFSELCVQGMLKAASNSCLICVLRGRPCPMLGKLKRHQGSPGNWLGS